MGPPPERAPRPRPEVNTGRPPGWLGWRSCRGAVGAPGRRRAEPRARATGGRTKFWNLARPRRRSALGGKLEPPFRAGEAGADRVPLSPLATLRGRPRSGRRRLAVGTPSHFLLVAYPPAAASAGGSGPRPGAGSGVGVWREEAPPPPRPRTHTPPSPAVETCPAGLPGAPRPLCPRSSGDLAFVTCVSEPACETKLYCAVTSHKVREWGRAGACSEASALPRCPGFQTLLPPPVFKPVSWPDNKRAPSPKLSLVRCLSSDRGVRNHARRSDCWRSCHLTHILKNCFKTTCLI